MIIDCHVHLSRLGPDAAPTLAERVRALGEAMEVAGVDRAVVLTSHLFGDDDPSPGQVLDAVGDDPRFLVVAGVDCARGEPRNLDELRGLLREERIRGLKLYPGYQPFWVHDAALRPVYQLAGEHGVPVMIHTGDTFLPQALVKQAHPLTVDEVAVAFPEVTFVLCHTGSPWFTDAMEVLYKNENVVADISGLVLGPFRPRYRALVQARLGEVVAYLERPDKLLFGTDWPITPLDGYLAFARGLPMTPEERDGLLWRNAARVFSMAEVAREAPGDTGSGPCDDPLVATSAEALLRGLSGPSGGRGGPPSRGPATAQ